jgi:hypothetical protein
MGRIPCRDRGKRKHGRFCGSAVDIFGWQLPSRSRCAWVYLSPPPPRRLKRPPGHLTLMGETAPNRPLKEVAVPRHPRRPSRRRPLTRSHPRPERSSRGRSPPTPRCVPHRRPRDVGRLKQKVREAKIPRAVTRLRARPPSPEVGLHRPPHIRRRAHGRGRAHGRLKEKAREAQIPRAVTQLLARPPSPEVGLQRPPRTRRRARNRMAAGDLRMRRAVADRSAPKGIPRRRRPIDRRCLARGATRTAARTRVGPRIAPRHPREPVLR